MRKNPLNDLGKKQVEVYAPYYELVRRVYPKEDVKAVVNDLIMMQLEKDAFLRRHAPKLKFLTVEGNAMILEDTREDNLRNAYVTLHGDKLKCSLDKGDDCCIHIRYALARRELSNLLPKIPLPSEVNE